MTDLEKSKTGSDVSDVVSGTLGDTIVAWLEACAANEIEPRVSCKTNEVTLKAGPRAWKIDCTPESMLAALLPFKGDARFQRSGVKRNGYTSCVYLLRHPKDVPYVANGHTRGTRQTEGNTRTTVLGSVAKAEAAAAKAVKAVEALRVKLAEAEAAAVKAAAAVENARQAEALHAAAKAEAAKAEAVKNRSALLAKAEALRVKAAKAAAEAAELDKLLAEAAAA